MSDSSSITTIEDLVNSEDEVEKRKIRESINKRKREQSGTDQDSSSVATNDELANSEDEVEKRKIRESIEERKREESVLNLDLSSLVIDDAPANEVTEEELQEKISKLIEVNEKEKEKKAKNLMELKKKEEKNEQLMSELRKSIKLMSNLQSSSKPDVKNKHLIGLLQKRLKEKNVLHLHPTAPGAEAKARRELDQRLCYTFDWNVHVADAVNVPTFESNSPIFLTEFHEIAMSLKTSWYSCPKCNKTSWHLLLYCWADSGAGGRVNLSDKFTFDMPTQPYDPFEFCATNAANTVFCGAVSLDKRPVHGPRRIRIQCRLPYDYWVARYDPSKRTTSFRIQDDLYDQYFSMLNEGDHSDVQIQCGEYTFKAHRHILSAASESFRDMFERAGKGAPLEHIVVDGVPVRTMQFFLKTIYTGRVEGLRERFKDYMLLAYSFRVPSLMRVCDTFIKVCLENAGLDPQTGWPDISRRPPGLSRRDPSSSLSDPAEYKLIAREARLLKVRETDKQLVLRYAAHRKEAQAAAQAARLAQIKRANERPATSINLEAAAEMEAMAKTLYSGKHDFELSPELEEGDRKEIKEIPSAPAAEEIDYVDVDAGAEPTKARKKIKRVLKKPPPETLHVIKEARASLEREVLDQIELPKNPPQQQQKQPQAKPAAQPLPPIQTRKTKVKKGRKK